MGEGMGGVNGEGEERGEWEKGWGRGGINGRREG